MPSLFARAIYCELLGDKHSALKLYVNILHKDSSNSEAKIAIRRLSGVYRKFDNLNEKMLNDFALMQNDGEYLGFEKWLLKTKM